MKKHEPGLRALGLAVLGVLSLMALFATGAQGQELSPAKASELANLGKFVIGGGAALLAAVEGIQEGVGSLQVSGKFIRLECATGSVTGGKINSATEASATFVLFSGCLVLSLKKEHVANCTVLTQKGGEPTGSIKTNAVLALPVLHGTGNYVAFEPAAGITFVTIEIHGSECPYPLENPLTGYVVGQVTTNGVVEPLLTFSQAISELVGKNRLLFGASPAILNSSFKGKLLSPHALTLGVV